MTDRECIGILAMRTEASKWSKPTNYEKHWGQVSPTFDTGGKVVGKAFIGSTVNAMNKGGEEFFKLYKASKINKGIRLQVVHHLVFIVISSRYKNMEEFTDKVWCLS